MNTNLHQYPAALYSAVSEFGYRDEQFTGEVLRSGRAHRAERTAHRRSFLSWLRRTGTRPAAAGCEPMLRTH